VWFTAASLAGWLFESLYAIVRTGHWERREFLYGPCCPIYGVGLVAAILLFDRPEVVSGDLPPWAVFVHSMCGSAVLEYTVSVAFENLFGAVWWDYSDMLLTLNGRICLPASLFVRACGRRCGGHSPCAYTSTSLSAVRSCMIIISTTGMTRGTQGMQRSIRCALFAMPRRTLA
jgi:hypothetical protein